MANFLGAVGYGAIVAFVGIVVVFIGLILLIGAIMLISKIIQIMQAPKTKAAAVEAVKEPEPAPAPAETEAPAPEAETVEVTDSNELIAVIAAAVAAFDGGNKPLVIRSVRRVTGWKNAARAEQVLKY